jgi:SAM-dependent methyltransferase
MTTINLENYWETRLKKSFGPEGVGYLGLGRQYNNWLYKVRRRVFNSQMRSAKIDLSEAEVLDIGSGVGFYIDRWKELGVKKVIGTDITNVAVEALKKKYPKDEFFRMDIGDDLASIAHRRFDVASAFDVLFHIVDDARFEKAIQNIHSLLKSDGLFVFSDNFLHGETIRAEFQVSRSLHGIEKVLSANGFKIVARVPMFFLMNYPVDSKNRLLKRIWRTMAKVISIHEFCGFLIGALLYPVELVCLALIKESPTTEMMICRKTV